MLWNHKNKSNINLCDSYNLFNPVKHQWSVKSNIYIVEQLLQLQYKHQNFREELTTVLMNILINVSTIFRKNQWWDINGFFATAKIMLQIYMDHCSDSSYVEDPESRNRHVIAY